jgi:hypothetical protein
VSGCDAVRLRLAIAVVSLSCAGLACSPQSPDARPAGSPSELSLAEQAQQVRDGRSTQIRMDDTRVSDADLNLLSGLEDKLERVNFARSSISDEGIERLSHFERLEQLRLASSLIGDAGVSHLKGLKQLRHLHLIDAPITDVGLADLQGISSLESLYLDGTKVSDAGVRQFIDAMPQVHFHVDGGHHRADPHADSHEPAAVEKSDGV